MQENIEMVRPWYQEFWVWVIIGLPLSVIIGCFFTVIIAFQNADSIVDENANNDPVVINEILKKQKMARAMSLRAAVSISRQSGKVMLTLQHGKAESFKKNSVLAYKPKTLILKLEHPTLKQYDQNIALYKTQRGEYEGQLNLFYSGMRYVSLMPKEETWILKGKMKLFSDTQQTIG